jgi:glycosyltransferase involved in cell wall biosynthesis
VNNVPGEPAEIIAAGAVGYSVPPRNAVELAAQLRKAVNDPNGIRRLMESARAEFDRQFDREHIQTRYVAHLAALISA